MSLLPKKFSISLEKKKVYIKFLISEMYIMRKNNHIEHFLSNEMT